MGAAAASGHAAVQLRVIQVTTYGHVSGPLHSPAVHLHHPEPPFHAHSVRFDRVTDEGELTVKLYRAGVVAGLIASGLLLAACGSSSKNSGGSSTTPAGGNSSTSTTDCKTGTLKSDGSTAQQNAMTQWIKDYQTKCSGATITYLTAPPTGTKINCLWY